MLLRLQPIERESSKGRGEKSTENSRKAVENLFVSELTLEGSFEVPGQKGKGEDD